MTMPMLDVTGLTYRYGQHTALSDVTFSIPEGALYALLGPNGSGKTTLLQVLLGVRRPSAGRATVMGVDSSALTWRHRQRIAYIAEGQALPEWMRLQELEAYLAPLYPDWDSSLAATLRDRFELDPRQKVGTLSRGQQMKAALLCALAPRPRLLIMDEPFTGMDAVVKDELVRGLLESAAGESWTVVICSHDIGELELLADSVGFLDHGAMRLSTTIDDLRDRFHFVEVQMADGSAPEPRPGEWMSVDEAGSRLSFVISHSGGEPVDAVVRRHLGAAAEVSVRSATLREVFVALARSSRGDRNVTLRRFAA